MKIGIFGGSFNPVHIGHLIIADFIRQQAGLDHVLMMLSPLNPLKVGSTELVDDAHRLAMLRIACEGSKLVACDRELTMPRPSYTINTLRQLHAEGYDDISLIIGGDNWDIFPRWKCADEILRDYQVIVYPRAGSDAAPSAAGDSETASVTNPRFIQAPRIDISSTYIRNLIGQGFDPGFMLPAGVYNYIKENRLYQR